jgi:hypothetical protein
VRVEIDAAGPHAVSVFLAADNGRWVTLVSSQSPEPVFLESDERRPLVVVSVNLVPTAHRALTALADALAAM